MTLVQFWKKLLAAMWLIILAGAFMVLTPTEIRNDILWAIGCGVGFMVLVGSVLWALVELVGERQP